LNIYPNPAKNEITIEFKVYKGKHFFIDLYNGLGEKTKTFETEESIIQIPLGDLHSGQCYIYISDGMTVNYGKKVIINAP